MVKREWSEQVSSKEPTPEKSSDKPKAYTIKYKRPRGSRACTVCRARKVRCDAEIHIPCTNCITFGCECVLPETKKKSGSGDTPRRNRHAAGKSDTTHDQDTDLNSVDDEPSHKSTLHSNSRPAAPSPVVPGSGAAVLEPIHNISQVSVPPLLTSPYKNRPSMHKRELITSKTRGSLTFVGHLSISMMAQKIGQNHLELTLDLFEVSDNSSLDLVELEILKMRGAFLLPSSQLASDLIELYFEHVHPLMPIINRTEFMKKFEDPNDSPSLMLLQAVLLCGSRVLKNPLLYDNKGLSNLASITFFRRAKALYETNYESDPVSIVQTVILIGSFWEGPEDVTRNSYYWTRVGVGLAQGFGFHRDISALPSLTASDKKIWRRIWWCLFEKDRNVAIAFGRPPSIDLTDCDVPMLVLEDFDESDESLGVVLPFPVNETHALYFIHLVKLAEITGIIIKHQYTVKAELMKRTNKFSIIQRCDMLMGIWLTNLPSQLQFLLNDNEKQNFYACLLNAQYYNRLYLIHRANLLKMARSSSTNPNNYKYPSWGISFQAARMISIVSKIMMDKKQLRYCPVMLVYILFSALIMLVYHVDSSNVVIASAASDSLFITRAVLKELGNFWPIVGVILKLFDKYANDKIKRAQMIERGTIIAEMLEMNSKRHSSTGNNPVRNMDSPGLSTSGVSPRASGANKQNLGDFANARVEEDQPHFAGSAAQQGAKLTNAETTPSSQTSFPDISLVTEKLPASLNFLENFEPTQLFPNGVGSYPPSRALSPAPEQERLKGLTGIEGGALTTSLNGDIFTNFMDNTFINMNFQAPAEENYLEDDINNLFSAS